MWRDRAVVGSATTFEEIFHELDALCQRRAAVYPVRDVTHAALSAKLTEYCHWLQSQQPPSWQPNPALAQRAEALGPIFVGGFYKSGTTFVLNLLDGHPNLSALPGDAKLLRFTRQTTTLSPNERAQALRERWMHALVNPTGLPPFWLFGHDAVPYLNFLNFLDYWLSRVEHCDRRLIDSVAWAYYCANPSGSLQARYWVDKTPTQELDAADLLMLYPKARFVHVVRNPLGIIAAMKTIASNRGQQFRMMHMLGELRTSMRCGLQNQDREGRSRYIIVRYEDILADPPGIMARLAEQLGIPYHDTLLEPTINGMPSTSNSAYRENRLQGQIQTQSLERWRDKLTRGEIAQIVDVLHDEAAAYDYDLSDLRPRGVRQAQVRAARLATQAVLSPLSRLISRTAQAMRRRFPFLGRVRMS